MNIETLKLLFWIFFGVIFYTFLGYGILLFFLVKIKKMFFPKKKYQLQQFPEITLLIAAYNEADIIEVKMQNCRKLNYPKDKLHILWVTDGTTDNSNELLCAYPDVEVCFSPQRKGKTAALNHGIKSVKTDLVAFTDANTMLNEDSMLEIVKAFLDPEVGCVSGEKRIMVEERDGASAGGEGFYWKYESKLKQWDSELYTAVGAAGELFAIRTSYYKQMPEDTLLDDFMLSMGIAASGKKIAYCKEAYACESGSADMQNEGKRKVRIAAGGLQSIFRLLPLFNIFRYGMLSFQYVSHRVLRWSVTPLLLFLLYPLNLWIALADVSVFFKVLFLLQTVFYLMAFVGAVLQNRHIKVKILFIPMYFVFMNINVLRAIPYLIKNKGIGAWEKAKRIK